MNSGQANHLSVHSPTRGTRAVPRGVGYVSNGRVFSLSRSLPSPLSADDCLSLFEWFIGTMPQCDSSQTYTRAVRPEPSPADLPPGLAAGVSEVSRFSCMKFLDVLWGLRPRQTEQELVLSLLSMLPSAHIYRVGVWVVCFRGSIPTPPILYLRFTASLAVAAQDSRPSGSLFLSCKALASSTSCRFIPAHKHLHYMQYKKAPIFCGRSVR